MSSRIPFHRYPPWGVTLTWWRGLKRGRRHRFLWRLARLCRIWWTKHSPFITGRGGLTVMSIVLSLPPPRTGFVDQALPLHHRQRVMSIVLDLLQVPPRAALSLPTCLPCVASRILPALPHLGVEPTSGLDVVPFGGQHAPLVGELG